MTDQTPPAVGDTVTLPTRLHRIATTGRVTNIMTDGALTQVDLGAVGKIWFDTTELTRLDPTLPTTHVLLIIDKSGSMGMYNLAADTIGGYNTYLDTLAGTPNVRITTTLFDTTFTALCVDTPIGEAPRLDHKTYVPGGGTALLEGIARTITTFEQAHILKPGDKVLLVISTDGEENSSGREYTWAHTNTMIDARVATGQWASIYLGQGRDAWKQDNRFSGSTHAVHTTADTKGTQSAYSGIALATVDYVELGDAKSAAETLRAATGNPGGTNG